MEDLTFSKSDLLEMLRRMVLIRHLEETLNELFSRGMMYGTSHLYVGQEAVAVGGCWFLREGDLVASTHRGHGHAVAVGVDITKLACELLGREEGLCRGRGGTQHLSDMPRGFLGTNGITGGFIPIATGVAFAFKLQGRDNVILSFFGDGASNTGYFHESLNFASVRNLPVVFICENNFYAMSTHVNKSTSIDDIAKRASAYSMEGYIADGMDPIDVARVVYKGIEKARRGGGPTLIEAKTYRFLGHSKSDMRVYRTKEEEEMWRRRDPIENLSKKILEEGLASFEEVEDVKRRAMLEVDDAISKALRSPMPDPSQVYDGIFPFVRIPSWKGGLT